MLTCERHDVEYSAQKLLQIGHRWLNLYLMLSLPAFFTAIHLWQNSGSGRVVKSEFEAGRFAVLV